MATTDNLDDYLTTLANAFRVATNSNAPINAQIMLSKPSELAGSYKELQYIVSGERPEGQDIIVPSGITNVQGYIYSGGRYNSVYIPEGVVNLKGNCFQAVLFNDLYLPKSIKLIDKNAFSIRAYGGYNFNIHYGGTLEEFFSEDFVCNAPIFYINGGSGSLIVKLWINNEKITKLIIPSSVTTLDTKVQDLQLEELDFEENSSISLISKLPNAKILKLPKGEYALTYLEFNKLTNCEKLYFKGTIDDYFKIKMYTGSTNPAQTKTIFNVKGELYFNNELLGNEIVIPNTVLVIDKCQLADCINKVTSVILPITLTKIEHYALNMTLGSAYYNKLTLVFNNPTPPEVSNVNNLPNINYINKIIVPTGSLSAYKSKTNMTQLASKMYERINATLTIDATILNNENILYSVDSGEKQQFTSTSLNLNEVATLTIYNTSTDTINLGTTSGGTDIGVSGVNTTITYTFTSDTTIYITKA